MPTTHGAPAPPTIPPFLSSSASPMSFLCFPATASIDGPTPRRSTAGPQQQGRATARVAAHMAATSAGPAGDRPPDLPCAVVAGPASEGQVFDEMPDKGGPVLGAVSV
ncbi:hypothetical protein ZWY2020_036508 [Hordeum vulgare]|nr:hypothetical protein ZWY2020_036508 [Hordeum vulgare]